MNVLITDIDWDLATDENRDGEQGVTVPNETVVNVTVDDLDVDVDHIEDASRDDIHWAANSVLTETYGWCIKSSTMKD